MRYFSKRAALLIGELHDNVELPWPARRSVRTLARVVPAKPRRHVRSQAYVVMGGLVRAFQNVNESLDSGHLAGAAAIGLPSGRR